MSGSSSTVPGQDFDSHFERVSRLLQDEADKGALAAMYSELKSSVAALKSVQSADAAKAFVQKRLDWLKIMQSEAPIRPPELDTFLSRDPYLEPYAGAITTRYNMFARLLHQINTAEGGLDKFSRGYEKFGFTRSSNGIMFRDWLPGANEVFLTGDFNKWDRQSHPLKRDEFGVWEIFLPDAADGTPAIADQSYVKMAIRTKDGELVDRIPAWITFAEQPSGSITYEGVYLQPSQYVWQHQRPPRPRAPKIYEAHVGISSEKREIATYNHFADHILPRIAALGYNTIQLMAVMEHAYYGSFGYQVTNFFAVSSRYGTPGDLKRLIDLAHGYGITVLLDVVHSHASKNTLDGINQLDGTDACHFHAGPKGYHPQWDSRLFNYGAWEVLRFLLSNLRWYLEEYNFDGFRFDGVTSMLYSHHGLGRVFTGYHDYFSGDVENEACVYLMLANQLVHEVLPSALTIAEEVSGMPGLCRPVDEGGFGFDYRLSMAVPDMWIKVLKEQKDEEWNMGTFVFTLENRRTDEGTIAYAESHDQALVGDKTIAFWLMDKEMYTHMSVLTELTPVIDRGMAIHKMLRLLTHGLGGDGYLNFIGNEFGHPEWLDFPREGNGESFQHARRQWSLADDELLRYRFLNNWDIALQHVEENFKWLSSIPGFVTMKHEGDKVIVFDRAGLVFAFNFHPTMSFTDYRLGCPRPGKYQLVLCSDWKAFGGHSRLEGDFSDDFLADPMNKRLTIEGFGEHFTSPQPFNGREHSMLAYLPARCAVVFACLD